MNNSLKNTIVDLNLKLNGIILGQKSTSEQSLSSKNNAKFFNVFSDFSDIASSYSYIKDYKEFTFSLETLDKIKNCKNDVMNIFNNKNINSPVTSKNIICDTNESMKKEWFNFVNNQTDELIESLSIYYLVCNNKKSVNNILAKINNIRKKWPIESGDIASFTNYKIQGEQMIQSNHFSKPIEDFLIKVKDKRATLMDLTPEVLQWIHDEGIENNINLSIKV